MTRCVTDKNVARMHCLHLKLVHRYTYLINLATTRLCLNAFKLRTINNASVQKHVAVDCLKSMTMISRMKFDIFTFLIQISVQYYRRTPTYIHSSDMKKQDSKNQRVRTFSLSIWKGPNETRLRLISFLLCQCHYIEIFTSVH